MLFLNPFLLLGLFAVVIPVVFHLFNRHSAQTTGWGAMRFLADSVATRTRRIQIEDALLMVTRCLIFGLVALALARPFAPPGSMIPFAIVLPALLLAICLLAVAAALWENRHLRSWALFGSVAVLLLTGAAIFYENYLNLRRLGSGGGRDIAVIIDTSTSMAARADGETESNFERALDEARDIVLKSGSNAAFTIIAAGPSPAVKVPAPSLDRAQLSEILDKLPASDGQMRARRAILAAASALQAGSNDAKQIILITDGQSGGWQADDPAAWESLAAELDALPTRPQLLIRRLPLPRSFRNLAVTGIRFSREFIGIDRAVGIEVTVENTGTEAVTAKSVQLRIGKKTLTDKGLGQLPPGASGTLTFKHQFRRTGAQVVTAVAELDDDLDRDNTFSSAVPIIERLNVMLVDGNPAPKFFDRASAFVELALAPGLLSRKAYLIEPTIVPASQILNVQSFDAYQAIILADVPRLPGPISRQLVAYINRGGGLLIAPGGRAIPEFYNNWEASPAQLITFSGEDPEPGPAGLDLTSFNHPALSKVAQPGLNDLASVQLDAYWQLQATSQGSRTAAKLDTGAPFVAARLLGAGKVLMTCCSLDTRSGNLATRESFLPFLHELVYHIATPDSLQLNLDPAAGLALLIDPAETSTSDEPLDTFAATDPSGQIREAQLVRTPRGTFATVTGDTMAGLYEIEIPDSAREAFEGILTPANTIPFTVIRPAQESRLTPITRTDLNFINRHIDVLQPASTKDVHTILNGRSYGQELWRYLAVGVLILLILEIALSRWIAINRKTGNQPVVEFNL